MSRQKNMRGVSKGKRRSQLQGNLDALLSRNLLEKNPSSMGAQKCTKDWGDVKKTIWFVTYDPHGESGKKRGPEETKGLPPYNRGKQ